MPNWSELAARLGYRVDNQMDELRRRLGRRLGYSRGPVQIVPYRTYGTATEFFLAGRVLENRHELQAQDDDTLWKNLLAMVRRFASQEVAGAHLRAEFQGVAATAVTDAEGYYQMQLALPEPAPVTAGWIKVDIHLEKAPAYGQVEAHAQADVLLPPDHARFGIISDIDDTIMVTHAAHLVKMAKLVFLGNARTRMPFPGVAAFIQALHRGQDGDEGNPLFFVSSSPWNLYDLLVEFMELNGIPPAPLLLTDYGTNEDSFLFSGHHTHKLEQIRRILTTYPALPFILLGDSGQQDPEIYQQIVETFPGRILAIYIRDVSQPRRDAEVIRIQETLGAGTVEMLLEADTLPATHHAVGAGFIDPAALAEIGRRAGEDERGPGLVEAALDEVEAPREQP